MDLSACFSLRHQIGTRQRYQIRSANPLNWEALSKALGRCLGNSTWQWRVNRLAACVVIQQRPEAGQEAASPANARQRVEQALIEALNHLGVQPPLPQLSAHPSLPKPPESRHLPGLRQPTASHGQLRANQAAVPHREPTVAAQIRKDPMSALHQYVVVTGAYWAFTLSDGALRMLVLFHFHLIGYTTLEIALLFLFYEFFGIVTNFFGGWLAARFGLRLTLWAGLVMQIGALLMLVPVAATWPKLLSVLYVMAAQAISGIAKDLNKMSAKSAIKTVVAETTNPTNGQKQLFKWVAILTGSKNALKGLGFFLGGVLLTTVGFSGSVAALAIALSFALVATLSLPKEIGKMKTKPSFSSLLSKTPGVKILSLARFFLFGARDVWFVVALPVFLEAALGWQFWEVGAFMGLWVIGYGIVQASAPALRRAWGQDRPPGPRSVQFWSALLTGVPAMIAMSLLLQLAHPGVVVVTGLIIFGIVFAMNSSIHSYLILAYTDAESVTLNVSFYYMANAAGRLIGTLLSGWVYLQGGIQACLWCSTLLVAASFATSLRLPMLPKASSPTQEAEDNSSRPQPYLQTAQKPEANHIPSISGTAQRKQTSSPSWKLSSTALAKRLRSNYQAITARRKRGDLETWSKDRDPDGVAWFYSSDNNTYQPLAFP